MNTNTNIVVGNIAMQIIDGEPVTIRTESYVSPGLPYYNIIGMVSEDGTRSLVKAACEASGLAWPGTRATTNLSPASKRKSARIMAASVAASVLAAEHAINPMRYTETLIIGGLDETGNITPADHARELLETAAAQHIPYAVIPEANKDDAAGVEGIHVFTARTLGQLAGHADPTRPEHEPLRAEVTGYITAYWQEACDGHPYYAFRHPGQDARDMAYAYMSERYEDYLADMQSTDPRRLASLAAQSPDITDTRATPVQQACAAFDAMFDLIWPEH